jgi:hypothetical protein
MKNFHAFLSLLFVMFLLASVTERSSAQSHCPSSICGIPICTGFWVDLDTSPVHKRINKLEQSADSLRKEAMRLQDSIAGIESSGGGASLLPKNFGHFFQNSDSLLGPGSVFGNSTPKDFHFEIPNLPENRFFDRFPNGTIEGFTSPEIRKKKAPIKGFKGWYIEELADNRE